MRHFATITDYNQFAISQYKLNTNSHSTIGNYDNLERQYNYPDDKTRKQLIDSGAYGNQLQLNACRRCCNVQKSLNSKVQHYNLCIKNEPGNAVMPNTEIRKWLKDKILENKFSYTPESAYKISNNQDGGLDIVQVRDNQFYNLEENRNNILKFKNFNHKNPVPFRIYADLESLAQKLHRRIIELEELRSRKESYQVKVSKQKVSQYCIYVVSDHEELFPSGKYQYTAMAKSLCSPTFSTVDKMK
jgi:hypothetical protein